MSQKFFKTAIALFSALALCFSSLLTLTGFAEGGSYYIASPLSDTDESIKAACETLAKYLTQLTGKEQSFDEEVSGIKFLLDYTDEVAANGYIIEANPDAISIKGNGARGIIHGVYAFLEKYCGCDWYTRDLISVPKNTDISIKTGERTVYEPYFEYTDTDWASGDLEFSLANGLTGGVYRDIPTEFGGEVSYLGQFAHTLTTKFCAASKYFEVHPEYFALHNGERTPDQLCLTNENTYKIVRDEVLALLRENHNPKEYLQIVSLTQNDNQNMCQCDSCKAIDDANGSYAGTMITFVNKIAKEVKAAGYSNVAIDTFAYQYTRKAPIEVVPDDNVIVRICTIECCFAHSLDDSDCSENVSLMEDLTNWGKICNRIYIWDYTTNYTNTVGIFPDFSVLQKNIQIFHKNNVKGIYEEGNYYIGECDTEFGALRCYLLAKLMQNPYLDYEKTIEEFNNAFYGNAGQYITEFIKMTMAKAVPENKHLMINVGMSDTLGFNSDDIKTADALWEKAKQAVADNEETLNRVKRSELCWRYWKCHRLSFSAAADINALIESAKDFGVVTISEHIGTDPISPDTIKSRILNELAAKTVDFVYPVLFVIALILTFVAAVIALKIKPKKWIYPVSFLISAVFIEILGWNRRAYIAWVDINEWVLTLVLTVLLFALLGAISVRGKKSRIKTAILCAVIFFLLYAIGTVGVNNLIFNGGANVLGIGVAYTLASIFAIVLQSISLKNIIKDMKTAKTE